VRGRHIPPPEGGAPATRAQTWQAVACSLLVTAVWRLLSPLVTQPACCDAAEYLRIAADPGQAVPRPYGTRVLIPWLVYLSGGDTVAVYHAISLVCLAATGPLVYLLARRLGAPHGWAMLAAAALLSSRGWVFYLYDPYLSDPAAFPLLAAALLVVVRGRPLWLVAPILALMAATRELFAGVALPLYAWLRRRPVDLAAAARTVLLLAPGVIVYLLLGQLTPGSPSRMQSQSVAEWLAFIVGGRMEQDGVLWFTSGFTMSLGLWWVLALGAVRHPGIRRLAWWLLPVFATLPFGWDWSRFLLYAFPVVLPAGALTLARSPRRRLLAGLVLVQASLPALDLATDHPQLNRPGPSLVLSLLLTVAAAVVLLLDRHDRRRPGRADPRDAAERGDPVEQGSPSR
jgi:hypothetical protein